MANKKVCKTCDIFGECKDSPATWFFLFIGLIATIAVRAVNLVMDANPIWAKIFWYIGIIGFTIYFLYKFRQDIIVKKELQRLHLSDKLSQGEDLSKEDYLFIKTMLCGIKSKKDAVNYFFIFFSSGVALLLGLLQDFVWKQ
jgi:hypothetical protein